MHFKFQILLPVPVVLVGFLISLVRVSAIRCSTQYGPCPDEYVGRLASFNKRPLYAINAGEIKKGLPAQAGEVRTIKHLTGRLEVSVEVEKPRVAVQLGDDAGKQWLVTLDGAVVAQTNQTSLPKMIVRSGKISRDDQNFVSAVKLTELTARARKTDRAELIGENLTIYTDGIQVIMPLVGHDPQVLVGSLQLILERGTIEGKRPVKIDLRFKNAVVIY